jgi:UDP-N-acetylglucosamine 4-epimerase
MIRDAVARRRPAARGAAPVHDAFRPGDIAHSRADIARAGRALGYEPIYRVAEGLPLVVDWYLEGADTGSKRG